MEKQSFLNLLIISVVLGQGIVVASGGNREASSALLIRKKRTPNPSSEASTSSGRGGQKRKCPPDPATRGVRMIPPPRWDRPLLTGMVRIYHGNTEIGIGVVAHPRNFVTKAHYFPGEVQAGEYHVEFRGEDGTTFSRDVINAKSSSLYKKNNERAWGPNDVAYCDTDGDMPKARLVSQVLKETRLFTREQIFWIASRTSCFGGPPDI